jgi:hypothetical protein
MAGDFQPFLNPLQFLARIPDEIFYTPSMHFVRREAKLLTVFSRHVLIKWRAVFEAGHSQKLWRIWCDDDSLSG